MQNKLKLEKLLKCKKKGIIQIWILALIFIFFILLVLFGLASNYILNEQLNTVKDGADVSNLAVYKNINQKYLADTGKIVFQDEDLNEALETFKAYIEDNYSLDTNLEPKTDSYITGQVKINRFILYSVVDGKTTAWDLDTSTLTFTKIYDSTTDAVFTPSPKHKEVTKTSVYSEVLVPMTFPMIGKKSVNIPSYTDVVKK